MYPLVFVVAGIVLLLNASWFHGASLVGWILVGIGTLLTLYVAIVLRVFVDLIKEVKGPGTPRPSQTRPRRRL